MTKPKYWTVTIVPADAGFGEWDRALKGFSSPHNSVGSAIAFWKHSFDQPKEANVYELGVDELPPDVEDITGLIHDEPPRVFAMRDGYGGAMYLQD